ncbi:MAG TPA: magnesium chelatase, partial [Planctomycetota bacterium]|nr:magnesium chelatase [Planctomycetota bacterium]
ITPLKDRIDSQIMTHYPAKLADAMTITTQESWTERGAVKVNVPKFIREIVDEVAFQARKSEFLDQSSGVSARLSISFFENVVSNAERRAVMCGEAETTARPGDLQQAVSAVTGKVELVYEGEQEGALNVARHLIGRALKVVFDRNLPDAYKSGSKEDASFGPYKAVVQYFAKGKNVELTDEMPGSELLKALKQVDGLEEITRKHIQLERESDLGSALEFVLEGLHQSRLVAKDELEGHLRYKDMLGSMLEGMDEGKPPRPPRERGRNRE